MIDTRKAEIFKRKMFQPLQPLGRGKTPFLHFFEQIQYLLSIHMARTNQARIKGGPAPDPCHDLV